MSALPSLTPIWIRLDTAIRRHVDADDVEEFLDTVVTIANQHDTHQGRGAGDAYLERVINSLTGATTNDSRDTKFPGARLED